MSKIISTVEVKRAGDNSDTSVGLIYLDGVLACGSIEDQEQKGGKVAKETRVSNGVYRLALRKEGGFHSKYAKKFAYKGKDWHQGMLCIYNQLNWKLRCPDGKTFQYVLIHIGNTDDNTDACLLPNFVLNFNTYVGSQSTQAYEYIYPIIRDSILASNKIDEFGNKYIEIKYSDIEEGK